jgi:hypothetical protein
MKKILSTTLLSLLLIIGTRVSAQNNTETRSVSDFNSVASSGPFNVFIKLDGTESLKLTGDEATLKDVETTVKDGALTIRLKKEINWTKSAGNKTNIYITAKSLKALVNSGSGSMKVDGTINSTSLSAVLSGSGSISSDIKTKQLRAVISGSGSISLSGSADEANVVLSGSGNMRAKELGTESTSAVVSGSGNVYVAANKNINARIVGSGQVVYSGDAKVQSTAIGSGRVVKAN